MFSAISLSLHDDDDDDVILASTPNRSSGLFQIQISMHFSPLTFVLYTQLIAHILLFNYPDITW
jgi:hypothetical protein